MLDRSLDSFADVKRMMCNRSFSCPECGSLLSACPADRCSSCVLNGSRTTLQNRSYRDHEYRNERELMRCSADLHLSRCCDVAASLDPSSPFFQTFQWFLL